MTVDLPPLDLHAHTNEVGGSPLVPGARIFGQTMTPGEWDEVIALPPVEGVVWGLGLHPIYTKSRGDLDPFLTRIPSCAAVGEVGLDNTGLSAIVAGEQRSILATILGHQATRDRLVSIHALLAYADAVAILADHPVPGAILHWWCASGPPLRQAIDQDLFFSINAAVVADPEQAVVLPDLPRNRLLVETDSPFIDRETGRPLNPWADTDSERAAGRALRSGEVVPVERALGRVWGVAPEEVRWQLWRNLAELESRVALKPFGSAEVLAAAGYQPPEG